MALWQLGGETWSERVVEKRLVGIIQELSKKLAGLFDGERRRTVVSGYGPY
jgi:hypothetical protein